MRLYSWRDYKCTLCKVFFTGDKLLKVPSLWGYDLPMCRACYKGAK